MAMLRRMGEEQLRHRASDVALAWDDMCVGQSHGHAILSLPGNQRAHTDPSYNIL